MIPKIKLLPQLGIIFYIQIYQYISSFSSFNIFAFTYKYINIYLVFPLLIFLLILVHKYSLMVITSHLNMKGSKFEYALP